METFFRVVLLASLWVIARRELGVDRRIWGYHVGRMVPVRRPRNYWTSAAVLFSVRASTPRFALVERPTNTGSRRHHTYRNEEYTSRSPAVESETNTSAEIDSRTLVRRIHSIPSVIPFCPVPSHLASSRSGDRQHATDLDPLLCYCTFTNIPSLTLFFPSFSSFLLFFLFSFTLSLELRVTLCFFLFSRLLLAKCLLSTRKSLFHVLIRISGYFRLYFCRYQYASVVTLILRFARFSP